MRERQKDSSTTVTMFRHFDFINDVKMTTEVQKKFLIHYDVSDTKDPDGSQFRSLLLNINASSTSSPLQVFDNYELVDISQLTNEFKCLSDLRDNETVWQTYNENEKFAIEKYKLAIMQTVLNQLLQEHVNAAIKKIERIKEKSYWRWFLYGFLLLLELVPMLWGNFLGFMSLMLTIPGISKVAAQMSAIAACGIEVVLYYAVMGPLLKKGLGISSPNPIQPRLDVYGKQIETMEEIDSIMRIDNQLTSKKFASYLPLLKLFNKDLGHLKLEKFKETPIKKGVRYLLSGLNLLLNIGGGYFFAGALLAAAPATAALIGTPVGWGIIAFIIIGQLALRFVVRSNAMLNLLNPTAEQHEKVRKKISQFKSNDDQYREVLAAKQQRDALVDQSKQSYMQKAAKNSPFIDSYRGTYTYTRKNGRR